MYYLTVSYPILYNPSTSIAQVSFDARSSPSEKHIRVANAAALHMNNQTIRRYMYVERMYNSHTYFMRGNASPAHLQQISSTLEGTLETTRVHTFLMR